MFGEGLTWEESVPAQVGAMMGMQSANLAVHGFGSDQAYLRLAAELPRFRQPVAVVSLFMTALFGRNLDDDRPHLGPGLVWLPGGTARAAASLAQLRRALPQRDTVERGVTVTREVFRATVELARRAGPRHSSSCRNSARRHASNRRCGAGSSTSPGCRTCWSRSMRPGACRGTSTRTRSGARDRRRGRGPAGTAVAMGVTETGGQEIRS